MFHATNGSQHPTRNGKKNKGTKGEIRNLLLHLRKKSAFLIYDELITCWIEKLTKWDITKELNARRKEFLDSKLFLAIDKGIGVDVAAIRIWFQVKEMKTNTFFVFLSSCCMGRRVGRVRDVTDRHVEWWAHPFRWWMGQCPKRAGLSMYLCIYTWMNEWNEWVPYGHQRIFFVFFSRANKNLEKIIIYPPVARTLFWSTNPIDF